MTPLLVALVGGLGAASRFVVDGWFRGRWAGRLPLATIAINVSGSLVIGALAGALATGALPVTWYTVAATGFCGGYTTFSTAMVETVRLAQAGDRRRAVANALGTLVLTVAAASLGYLATAAWT
ncbi:MAG: CrcB family protein [Cellulomonas sp.]|uniref:fluoride efflux transporter FluC n=1 Tax=Cellulomonas sp. 73-92 TaxID=1895740 RepID=UPI00092BD3F3|nr:CrcB family protein [Cellulomonas sp. 73-92]MBN9375476.1 CrcB family protein [Cellulomonas sp.]OJV80240.1 MAG: chromosome condensation protein CrcB [Cellulomonas sp. 73-92]